MEDETGDAKTYTTQISNPAISAYADSDYKPYDPGSPDKNHNTKIPGGNSFGNGADARDNSKKLATKGGGGAQYCPKASGSSPEELTYGKGAAGFFALFY